MLPPHLNESLVPDHGEEGLEVLGEVHVQHEAAAHVLQRTKARGVGGLMKLGDDITQLRIQLQELLEGTAGDQQIKFHKTTNKRFYNPRTIAAGIKL